MRSIIEIIAAVIGWLLSPAAVKKREESRAEKQIQEDREAIVSGDADAVSARIDKLRNQHRLSQRNK